ncbi:hypothetical protein Q0Z83_012690 [Actinoplanes sichuanensis]|uniref:Copper oxidase n=1 Tax=Actinoplanes sichuanensis TaxID=512349 RepID=A0ABW4A4Y3_9ACTN|nr:hypothetical protein [Actinoplanes sichuanensis]BEL03078.1 hypothetical protein Q0Z83_012690 [Actinoplanes sichuanensis]
MNGRASWHRRVGLLPLAYLAALVVLACAHPLLPQWRWLAIHLLLLGAATNAILIWSAHFTAAVLRAPAPPHRRAEAIRLALLNGGILLILTGGARGVAGAVLVFAAIAAHLHRLVTQLRKALPSRFAVTVHYYAAATIALLTGIPAGGWMLVTDDDLRPRLILFHAHVNLLGWIMLTVLGTLLTFWPTVLRTRMDPKAVAAARTALPTAIIGIAALAVGVLAGWPPVAVAGLVVFVAAVVIALLPAARAARTRPPESFAAWSIAAGAGWLLIALAVDAHNLLTGSDNFANVLVPLLAGAVGQILLGSLAYLLPMALGGGPSRARERVAALDRHWPQRIAMTNGALIAFQLPVGAHTRITTSLLLFAALIQFLLPALRLLITDRRPPHAATPGTAPEASMSRPAGDPPTADQTDRRVERGGDHVSA